MRTSLDSPKTFPHLFLPQCKFEFCIGCDQPFKMGVKCGRGHGCAKMGLHAHHPRNCLFYLRDKEPRDLQKILKAAKVEFRVDPDPDRDPEGDRCRVMVQKETKEDGMVDDACGEEAPKGFGGFCK